MGIRLHALGGLKVFRDGEEVGNLRSWKRRLGLLIYLAYQGESTRDQLTGLFWPEKPERKARSSLSTAVSDLRKACGRECILTQGEIYRVSSDVELDARLFQQAVERGENEEALRLYQGPFLSGLSLVQTSAFQQWVGSAHSRLTGLHRKARSSKIEALTEAGQLTEALSHARRWVELEPEDDGPVQLTMKLLATDGRRAEALQQFETFQRAMALMDEDPLEETTELADRIRSGDEVGPVRMPALDGRGARAVEKPGEPREAEFSGQADTLITGGRPWLVELAETLKDWWVFRGVLAFFTFSFVAIGVADGLGVPPVTVRQLLALAVGSLVLLTPSLWAMESWLRRQLGFDPPRTWRERPKDPTRGLWQRRGMLISAAGLAGIVIAMALWPRTSSLSGEAGSPTSKTRLALLPILPADSTDEELSHLAEEISRATIAHFRGFEALDMPGWRRVAGYTDPTTPPDSIFSELGVDYFLSGELSIVGDSIHLRWDLEDGISLGEQIEIAVVGDADTNRFFVLQGIVRQITDGLRQELGEVIERRELRLGTASQEAWVAFEEGRRAGDDALSLISSNNVTLAAWTANQADSLFSLAASLDPAWAEPLILRAGGAPLRALTGLLAGGRDIPFAPDAEGRKEIGRQALAQIEEALSRDPGNRDALYLRASLSLDWGTYFEKLDPQTEEEGLRRAEEDLQRASRGVPPHPESMGMLAILLARDRRDFIQAKKWGQQALDQDPWLDSRTDVKYWLAIALFELGEDEEALAQCLDAARRPTTHIGTAWMLAECQLMVMALGELPNLSPDSAWAVLEGMGLRTSSGAAQSGPMPQADYRSRSLLLYAGILDAAGLPDSAQSVFNKLDTIEPGEISAGLMARLGEPEQGFENLQAFLQRGQQPNPDLILNSRTLRFLRGYPPFDSLRGSGG